MTLEVRCGLLGGAEVRPVRDVETPVIRRLHCGEHRRHESDSVRRGVCGTIDLYRAFISDTLAQRSRPRAPRMDELVWQRGSPGSVDHRLESGRTVCRRMVILRPPVNRGAFSKVRLGHGVRPVSGGVMFLGCLCVASWPAAVENGLHVGARLCVWRDAVVAPHGAGPCVVGGDGELGPELVGEAAQVGNAGVDVLPGVEGVGDAEVALRARHQLHQALGSGGRLRGCAVPGLDGDDGVHQVGVDAVPPGGGGDEVGERPLGALGRAREEAVAGGDEQQEYEATEGETRQRRHGERATYHIKDPYASLNGSLVRPAALRIGRRGIPEGG